MPPEKKQGRGAGPGGDANRPAPDGEAEIDRFLDGIHLPTTAAFIVGAAGGVYLGWVLFAGKGVVAVVLGVTAGLIFGIMLGVAGYWLLRLFQVFER